MGFCQVVVEVAVATESGTHSLGIHAKVMVVP